MRNQALKGVYAVVLVAGIAYAFIELRGPGGIGALLQRRALVTQYEAENQKLNQELQHRQDRIQRLEQNPTEQEFEIRRRLKLAKPGEKIFIIEPGSKK
ncbi:MAG: Septum formation initiator [Bryobacterales bacterium]|jgi:cell division protein FtsB|nr:Septum formation initiator [Bryobacterales bacterium]